MMRKRQTPSTVVWNLPNHISSSAVSHPWTRLWIMAGLMSLMILMSLALSQVPTTTYPPLWSWWWYPQWSYWWWSTDPQQGQGFRGQGGLSQLLGWCRFQVPAEKGLAWHVMTRKGSICIEVVAYQGKEWQQQPRHHDAQVGSPVEWGYMYIFWQKLYKKIPNFEVSYSILDLQRKKTMLISGDGYHN